MGYIKGSTQVDPFFIMFKIQKINKMLKICTKYVQIPLKKNNNKYII